MPEIALEGDEAIPLSSDTLVLEEVIDMALLRQAHEAGTPVVVRADSAEKVKRALARPEVACVLVPPHARDLLELDLTELTYG